ncbi:uncharacterized protein AMSG_10851 [Thecamonas trahens ATCC 50062]|uniref:Uncharacterized protein n=1 Tax=Thecamonas trahens ATCC 50062 TaxID=461836 RepID=A0A0L0DUQ3_THETB|nr:hypothetical protein AMSG_10851 [Thecamonas trahens ATCC 50062]KNC55223.1 hypothetical protein AMSG_10851 [Thecamonas trahens ATCC 50062]|eukprot:XP_013753153.1 hypothetical protein AMSG_10851 [Thecamonas trahens ATCC 50062]
MMLLLIRPSSYPAGMASRLWHRLQSRPSIAWKSSLPASASCSCGPLSSPSCLSFCLLAVPWPESDDHPPCARLQERESRLLMLAYPPDLSPHFASPLWQQRRATMGP